MISQGAENGLSDRTKRGRSVMLYGSIGAAPWFFRWFLETESFLSKNNGIYSKKYGNSECKNGKTRVREKGRGLPGSVRGIGQCRWSRSVAFFQIIIRARRAAWASVRLRACSLWVFDRRSAPLVPDAPWLGQYSRKRKTKGIQWFLQGG